MKIEIEVIEERINIIKKVNVLRELEDRKEKIYKKIKKIEIKIERKGNIGYR